MGKVDSDGNEDLTALKERKGGDKEWGNERIIFFQFNYNGNV